MNKINLLKIIHLNCRSILSESKKIQISQLILNNEPDFISLNETFLNTSSIFSICNYQIIRSDRIGKRGGGSALCVKSHIKGHQLDTTEFNETTGFITTIKINLEIAIFSIYSSPTTPLDEKFFEYVIKNFKHFIIIGDFNAKHTRWSCDSNNQKGKKLEAIIQKYNLFILNNSSPTYIRGNSVIDLTIGSSNLTQFFDSFQVLNEKISDHQPTLTIFKDLKPSTKSFEKIDWHKFKTLLSNESAATHEINTSEDLNEKTDKLIEEITLALKEATTQFSVRQANKPIQTIPHNILKLIKFKRKLKRLCNKYKYQSLKKLHNFVERILRRRLTEFRQIKLIEDFKDLENFNCSSTKHWNLIKKLESGKDQKHYKPPTIELDNLNKTCDPEVVTNLFADYLDSIFNADSSPITGLNENLNLTSHIPTSQEEIITASELTETLSLLRNQAAAGFDRISNKVLKNLPTNKLNEMLNIFNASIRLSHIPIEWKKSKIVMILKKNKPPDKVSSYRPISLLNCIAKLLEKIVNNRLQKWAETEKILPEVQSGFRKKRSTQDHIFRINQSIINGFNNKELTGAIFFDLEKAFDKTPHLGIVKKLEQHGLRQSLLNWIKNFLNNRTFQVFQNGTLSSSRPIKAGVPQGSCLSPTIFILYFSDIAKTLPPDVKIALFADDLCIWFTHKSKRIIKKILQSAINKIVEFCEKWGLTINKSKTCYTVFTSAGLRKNYVDKYSIELKVINELIPLEPNPTFLGIKLDPKLKYAEHLREVVKKATPKINILRKIKEFKWKSSLNLNKMLYKSLIRSLFDYCFVILQTGTQKILKDLQIFQNKIFRIIKFFPLKTSIETIHKTLHMEKIDDRANALFLKFLKSKKNIDLIAKEINDYSNNNNNSNQSKYKTPLDSCSF